MGCCSHGVGCTLQLPGGVGLVVNFLIVSEVMCGLLIWWVFWVPAMVEVPTPAETRKFWGLSSLLSTSSDRLMQMVLGGLGGGLGAQIMVCLWSFLLTENSPKGVKLLQMEQMWSILYHIFLELGTNVEWTIRKTLSPEGALLNQKFFKETLQALGRFSFSCHTVLQHDRNAALSGVFPPSILNLHILIALHSGGIVNSKGSCLWQRITGGVSSCAPLSVLLLQGKGKKVKVTLVQALRLCSDHMAHRGSRGIALPFHNHGTRRGWRVSITPLPLFTPGKDPVPIVQEAGWALGPVWTGAENLAPTGIRSLDRPAHSQSPYQLHYPAHPFTRRLW